MKNNKGFSTLELVISFSICMVVVVILFQIVISLKELYEKTVVKTELLSKQNLIVDQIYTDIYERGLSNVTTINDRNCLLFEYNDFVSKELCLENSKLKYGDYVTTINNISWISKAYSSYTETETGDIVNIELHYNHKLFPDDYDFGIYIVYFDYYE